MSFQSFDNHTDFYCLCLGFEGWYLSILRVGSREIEDFYCYLSDFLLLVQVYFSQSHDKEAEKDLHVYKNVSIEMIRFIFNNKMLYR